MVVGETFGDALLIFGNGGIVSFCFGEWVVLEKIAVGVDEVAILIEVGFLAALEGNRTAFDGVGAFVVFFLTVELGAGKGVGGVGARGSPGGILEHAFPIFKNAQLDYVEADGVGIHIAGGDDVFGASDGVDELIEADGLGRVFRWAKEVSLSETSAFGVAGGEASDDFVHGILDVSALLFGREFGEAAVGEGIDVGRGGKWRGWLLVIVAGAWNML